jgi:hypothetical protein
MTGAPACFDVREALDRAASFARAGDVTAAVACAAAAARFAAADDSREEAALVLGRLEGEERAWRDAIERRRAAFLARERAEAGIVDDEASVAPRPGREGAVADVSRLPIGRRAPSEPRAAAA